jgi:hypothetical protein
MKKTRQKSWGRDVRFWKERYERKTFNIASESDTSNKHTFFWNI